MTVREARSNVSRAVLLEAAILLAVTLSVALSLRFSAAWLLVPLAWLVWCRRNLEEFGLKTSGFGSVRFHLFQFTGVFAPYLLGHFAYGRLWQGRVFTLAFPAEFLAQIPEQILGIGLAEEFFFRAYLQTQLDRFFGHRWSLLGARLGYGWLASATIFALCHIFYGGPARLVTFFPALWYGWLWARTGNVFVPAFYHGTSNLLMMIMLTSFRPT